MSKPFLLVVTLLGCVVAACSSVPTTLPAGMSFSDEPLPGKVIWNDLITEDLPAAKRFYGGLFGWTFEDTRARNGADYAIARDGDVFVAGLLAFPPPEDGTNVTRWLPYMSVEDVDDALERGVAGGAGIAADAQDVPLGRVAAIIDPEGAVIGIAQSKVGDPDDTTTRPAPGRIVWTELLSGDPAAAAKFYGVLAGLEASVEERRGGTYTMLVGDGVNRAGILALPDEQMDPEWLTYIGVADPAATAARVEALGGQVLVAPDPDLREGTMAIITDPTGALLVLQKT